MVSMRIRNSETPLPVGEAAGTVLKIANRMGSGAGGWSLDYAATAKDAAGILLADCRRMLGTMQHEVNETNKMVLKLKALGHPTAPSELHQQATSALDGLPDESLHLNDAQLATIWTYALTWGSGCPVHEDLGALLMARAILSDDLRALEHRAPALTAWILRAGAAA